MKKPTLRLAAFLLSLLMTGVLAACAQSSQEIGGLSAGSTTFTEETTDPDARLESQLPDLDLEGMTITFAGKPYSSGAFGIRDVYAETETGDNVNDEVYRRNMRLLDKYNFNIEFVPVSDNDVTRFVQRLVASDDDYVDVIYDGLGKILTMAQQNQCIDMYMLEYFDFSKPWWDAEVNDELSIAGKLFATYGEHMLGPKSGLYCIFFNKTIAEEKNLGDLYQYVRDDQWTLDVFGELAMQGKEDMNGDQQWTIADRYGYVTEGYNAYTFMVSSGYKIASKDENDLPMLTPIDSTVHSYVDKMISVLANDEITLFVDRIVGTSDIWGAFWSGSFVSNLMLFREGAMHDTPNLRNMDADFGILPMPKFDENQERYYHTNSVVNAAMMGIPTTASDPNLVSFALEAMAYDSYYSLNRVYYDLVLTGKSIRDNESEEMLDIIFTSKTFDIGAAFNWGGIRDIYANVARDPSGVFASRYAAIEKQVQTALDKTIETFLDIL